MVAYQLLNILCMVGMATCAASSPSDRLAGAACSTAMRDSCTKTHDAAGVVLLARAMSVHKTAGNSLLQLRDMTPQALLSHVEGLATNRVLRSSVQNASSIYSDGGNSDAYVSAVEELILLLEGSLKTAIEEEVKADQAIIHHHVERISKCESEMEARKEELNDLKDQLELAEEAWKLCRSTEDTLWQSVRSDCAYANDTFKMAMPGCALGASYEPKEEWAHIPCLEGLNTTLHLAAELQAVCVQTAHEHKKKYEECAQENQTRYERIHCELKWMSSEACRLHSVCRERGIGEYDELQDDFEPLEEGRRHQITAIEKVKCYMYKVLKIDKTELADSGPERIAACKNLSTHKAEQHYALNFTDVPLSGGCIFATWANSTDVTCGTPPEISTPPTTSKAANGTYAGCMYPQKRWPVPRKVAVSRAGAEECQQVCRSKGYKYFGFECPRATWVPCRCSNDGLDGTELGDEYCEGKGNPLIRAHENCVGPYVKDGYRFGDAGVRAVYRTTTAAMTSPTQDDSV